VECLLVANDPAETDKPIDILFAVKTLVIDLGSSGDAGWCYHCCGHWFYFVDIVLTQYIPHLKPQP